MTEEQLATERGFASERKNGKARTHFVFVDVLNIISCFAVVCLHTSLGVFSPQRTRLWAFQELMQAVFIFAVPIFLGLVGGIAGMLIGSKGYALLWPYCLMQQGMNANRSTDQ